VLKGEASGSGEGRRLLWGGKNGLARPPLSVEGFQPLGGMENGGARGLRLTAL